MPQQISSTSDFSRFCTKILLPSLIVLSISGFLFSVVFERLVILNASISGAYKVNRLINYTYPDEIPIFGSSRAEIGFVPAILGRNFFNYGLSGTQDDVLIFFLQEECSKKKNNPLIIINYDLDGLNYTTGDIANYLYNSNYRPIKQLLGNQLRFYHNIPFIKYFGQYEKYFRYYLTSKLQINKYSDNGCVAEKRAIPKTKLAILVQKRALQKKTFRNDPFLLKQLFQLLHAHPERDFLFVVSPLHPSNFVNVTNLDAALHFLSKLKTMRNVKVLDFSNNSYADEMYLSPIHLNYTGAVAFSRQLKDSLLLCKFYNRDFRLSTIK
jgi:hypothetical protein